MTTTVATALDHFLVTLRQTPPAQRVAMADDLRAQLQDFQALVVQEKTRSVREMREDGLSPTEIGRVLGISLSRVKQIEEGPGGSKPKHTPDQLADKLRRQLARLEANAQAEVEGWAS
jgi:hypothetical protein